MRFVSTRGIAPAVGLGEAIRDGVAPDGGLYLPEHIPRADLSAVRGDMPLPDFAAVMLAPFFAGDPLEAALFAICGQAFDFPVPTVVPDAARPTMRVLELFHGPTGAFKDFGARFLLGCFERLGRQSAPLTVLVATSGDTGGAVGCAAEGRAGLRAVILYPRGRVSAFQQRQLTCWRAPVRALEVDGDFDDCQRLVKQAFADRAMGAAHNLTSANSINIARLLPQMVYLAAASMRSFAIDGVEPGFVMPTGNLGHGFAAVYARAMGFPIGPIVAATNANRALHEWHGSGCFAPGPSIATIANAMDVGSPSNFERLIHLAEGDRAITVEQVDDDAIRARVVADFRLFGYVWCPHSAVAAEAYARLDDSARAERGWLLAATAHAYKFADIVEPLIRRAVDAPPLLAAIGDRPVRKQRIAADLNSLRSAIDAFAS